MLKIPEEKLNRWLKIILLCLAALAAIYMLADHVLPVVLTVCRFIGPLLLPFILAFVLAILLEPLIELFQRRLHMSRTCAVVIALCIAFGLIFFVVGALISRLVVEISDLVKDLSNGMIGIDFDAIIAWIENFYNTFVADLGGTGLLPDGLQNVFGSVSEWSVGFLNGLGNVLSSTPAMLFMLLVMAFATYYFCKDKNMALRFLLKIIPKNHRSQVEDTYVSTINAFLGYFRAQLLLMAITMVISLIGLMVLRMDYVIVMAILIGFFDFLPVFGPGTIYIPWIIIRLVQGDIFTAVGLAIVYAICSVVRYVLQPKLIADGMDLHPLATITSIFLGLKIFGVIGILVGPILWVIGLAIYRAYKKGDEVS